MLQPAALSADVDVRRSDEHMVCAPDSFAHLYCRQTNLARHCE